MYCGKEYRRSSFVIYFYVIFCLFLFVFSGFRVDSGTDYEAHRAIFESVHNSGGFWRAIEPGFLLLIQLSGLITEDSQIIILTSSLITILLVCYRVYKDSLFPIVSLILFVLSYHYIQSFNLIRQYIAIGLYFCFAIQFIRSGSWIKYVILTVISSMFHVSAILLLPVYLIRKSRLSGLFYLTLLSLSGAAYILFPYLEKVVFSLFSNYQSYGDYKEGSANYSILLVFLMIFPVIYNLKLFLKRHPNNKYWLAMVVISIPLMLMAHHNAITHRMSLYFNVFLLMLIPAIIESLKSNSQKALYIGWCVIIAALHVIIYLSRNSAGVFPYSIEFGISF